MTFLEKLAEKMGKTVENMGEMSEEFAQEVFEALNKSEETAPPFTVAPEFAETLINSAKDVADGGKTFPARFVVNEQGVISVEGPSTQKRAIINTMTNGRVQERTINGRPHLVTQMVPIVKDTVMNGIFYNAEEVEKSFRQLDMLPAPADHPRLNGQNASAFNPLSQNAHNIGGFVMNPTIKGNKVITDYALDITVAEKDERGQETLKRLRNKEKIGVSTGLTLMLEDATGTGGDGVRFNAIAHDIEFDHVATLLNDEAAGAHVGTEMLFNEKSEPIFVCNVDAKQLEEIQPMTIEEMIANVEKEGYTVLPKDAPELKKLDITNEQLEAVEKMEQEKETALNSAKDELAKATNKKAEDYDGMSLDAVNGLIEALNTKTDYSALGGGGADDPKKGEVTADDVTAQYNKIMNPEEEEV